MSTQILVTTDATITRDDCSKKEAGKYMLHQKKEGTTFCDYHQQYGCQHVTAVTNDAKRQGTNVCLRLAVNNW